MDSAEMNWVSDHQPFHCVLLIIRISKVPLTITRRNSNLKTVLSGQNLDILNPLYDLTPPTYITAVVTEVGLIPPSSISSIPLALGKTTL
jgi:translation initiation factor eIF-2B subunit delta